MIEILIKQYLESKFPITNQIGREVLFPLLMIATVAIVIALIFLVMHLFSKAGTDVKIPI